MATQKISLRYGKTVQHAEVPSESLLGEINGHDRPGLTDLPAAYRQALEHPVDCPPLRELVRPGYRVTIAVSDITRAWQRNAETLPLLLDYLNEAGVRDEDVTVVIAVGAHRQNTEAEFKELCSPTVCHRVRVVNHDCYDEANQVYLGKTSRNTEVFLNRHFVDCDLSILTGGVIYHYMMGYGGGRKSVLPGVAGIKTIKQNHLWAMGPKPEDGTSPLCESGRTTGNPAAEDIMEIAAFAKPGFIVNVVPNFEGQLIGIFAGNWVSAWQGACRLVDEVFAADIKEKADIVIASAGGYPRDINLYQSQKTLVNACTAAKNGGVVIYLAECPDIKEPAEFFDWFQYPTHLGQVTALRNDFTIAGWVALAQTELCLTHRVIMVTRPENVELAAQAHVTPVATLEEAVKMAYALAGPDPKVWVMPFAANTVPFLRG